jgi:ABC-2 type transport system ATP-binding protein
MTAPAPTPAPSLAPILVLDQVSKRFAGHTAVDRLSLAVLPGVIFGLLGPNGAGKTTTIRMVMDILQPDSGSVQLFGDGAGGRLHGARVGYLPEERGLYRRMRVLDVLVFLGEMKGVERRWARQRAGEWLERLGLEEWRARRIEELSKGMQQKVQFIATVLHDPDLVILDEPFSGLDPVNAQVLKDVVVDLHRHGKTIVFSTHIMEQAEKLCDQICIIARGRKLVDGALSDIKRTHGGRHLVVGFDGGGGAAEAGAGMGMAARLFADGRLVSKVDNYGQYAELELAPGADAQHILRELVASGARLAKFELQEPSLHKIFIDLVGPDARVPTVRADHGGAP